MSKVACDCNKIEVIITMLELRCRYNSGESELSPVSFPFLSQVRTDCSTNMEHGATAELLI